MQDIVDIFLWGQKIGEMRHNETLEFHYSADFCAYNIELNPISQPLSGKPVSPALDIPPLLSDQLPSAFGTRLFQAISMETSPPHLLTTLGSFGFGAINIGQNQPNAGHHPLDLDDLIAQITALYKSDQAHHILNRQDQPITQCCLPTKTQYPSVLINWHEETGEVLYGNSPCAAEFTSWILHIDDDFEGLFFSPLLPRERHIMQFNYQQMAQNCAIKTAPCELLEQDDKLHLAQRRIDRDDQDVAYHCQSLAAFYPDQQDWSYEKAIDVSRLLNLDINTREQIVRRAVFHALGGFKDDHPAHLVFRMDKNACWSLGPLSESQFSFDDQQRAKHGHVMSINNKRHYFQKDDFKALAKYASLKRGHIDRIIDDIQSALDLWPSLCEEEGLNAPWVEVVSSAITSKKRAA